MCFIKPIRYAVCSLAEPAKRSSGSRAPPPPQLQKTFGRGASEYIEEALFVLRHVVLSLAPKTILCHGSQMSDCLQSGCTKFRSYNSAGQTYWHEMQVYAFQVFSGIAPPPAPLSPSPLRYPRSLSSSACRPPLPPPPEIKG